MKKKECKNNGGIGILDGVVGDKSVPVDSDWVIGDKGGRIAEMLLGGLYFRVFNSLLI